MNPDGVLASVSRHFGPFYHSTFTTPLILLYSLQLVQPQALTLAYLRNLEEELEAIKGKAKGRKKKN